MLNKKMENFKLALLHVSEVRQNGAGSITTRGNLFIYPGMPDKSEPHIRGVGKLINKNTKDALLVWKPVSELIITVRINTKFREITVVQCYAPTEIAYFEEKEVFYNCLDGTLLDLYRSDRILLMGDFNAEVGSVNQDIEDVIGKYGLSHRNENGDLLIEL
jgi:exonuclease III